MIRNMSKRVRGEHCVIILLIPYQIAPPPVLWLHLRNVIGPATHSTPDPFSLTNSVLFITERKHPCGELSL